MLSRAMLAALVLLLTTSSGYAFSELDERIPTSPDYRDVNGYFYQWQLSPQWGAGLFLGLDFQKRVVNLTPAIQMPGSPPELVLDDYRDGFRYTRVRGFDAALAPIGVLESAKSMGNWAPFAGLMPLYGSRSISSQFVSTREQMKELPRLKVPGKVSDLEEWNLNDWMTYETTGGVLFLLGAGSNVTAGVEFRFAAAGEWSMAIEKTGLSSIYVRISQKQIRSFTQIIGAATLALENTLFKNQDESFSYAFDLEHPEALVAYQEMLAGNLIPAQELAAKVSASVRSVDSLRSIEKGRLTTLRFGLPFFSYTGRVRGKIHVAQTHSTRTDGSATSTEIGVHLNERAVGGIFLINRRSINDFFATSVVTRTPEGTVVNEGYAGQFIWAYENAKASPKRLRKELTRLIRQTGLRDELTLTIPEANLGYLHTSLRVYFDQDTTDELIRAGLEQLSDNKAAGDLSTGFIKAYFANGDDPENLCYDAIDRCSRRLEKTTRAALSEAATGLKEMDQARKASDRSAFVRAYAAVGKALFRNQFTFKSTLAVLRGRPAAMRFTVAGERISLIKKNIEWRVAIP